MLYLFSKNISPSFYSCPLTINKKSINLKLEVLYEGIIKTFLMTETVSEKIIRKTKSSKGNLFTFSTRHKASSILNIRTTSAISFRNTRWKARFTVRIVKANVLVYALVLTVL